jgi:hypothetical protein
LGPVKAQPEAEAKERYAGFARDGREESGFLGLI